MIRRWETELIGVTKDSSIRLMATRKPEMAIELNVLAEVIGMVTGVFIERLAIKDRHRPVSHARHLFYYYARMYSHTSLVNIGKFLRRDHSTVIHGAQAVQERLDISDPETVLHVERINLYLNEIRKRAGDSIVQFAQ